MMRDHGVFVLKVTYEEEERQWDPDDDRSYSTGRWLKAEKKITIVAPKRGEAMVRAWLTEHQRYVSWRSIDVEVIECLPLDAFIQEHQW